MISGIQLFSILFAFLMLYIVFINFKKHDFTIKELLFWSAFWTLFAFFSLIPQALSPFAKTLKLTNNFTLLVILGFIFLIGLMFYNYTNIKKLQKKIEKTVSSFALKEGEK